MTNTNTIRSYSILYRDAQGQGWSRLARPGQLDRVLSDLRREQPKSRVVCVDATFRN